MGDSTAPDRVFAEFVTTNYFTVLGARPAAGRLFGPADAEALGASPVVVLSHKYWRDRLTATRLSWERPFGSTAIRSP